MVTDVAIDRMIDATKQDWVTPNDVPDPEVLPRIQGWNLLVRSLAPAEKTKGGIILADKSKDDLQYLTNVGRVVYMGPLCYTDPGVMTEAAKFPEVFDELANGDNPNKEYRLNRHGFYEEPWCQVGDWILWGKNKGAKIKWQEIIYVLLKDEDVVATLDDPSHISTLFNFEGLSS